MRVLVTGGAGFIGSHIGARFVARGDSVRVLDSFVTGKRENVAAIGPSEKVELIEGDVRDAAKVEAAVAGCEIVFHEAAVVSVPRSVEHPQESHDVNVQGTLHVLHAARRHGVKRVVFASSAAIYGEEPTLPKVETMAPAPIAPYGVDKISCEYYLQTWSKLYGVECVSLRYFNVFGPRQDPSSPYSGVISIFVDKALRGEAPTIFGDGEQFRDFVYVDNVVDANEKAALTPGIGGRVYNVGSGTRTSLNDLVRTLARITGTTLSPKHMAPRAGDIPFSVADITRAKNELGYAPRIALEQGLAELVARR
jgi:UDP-glucose 4-epimerase